MRHAPWVVAAVALCLSGCNVKALADAEAQKTATAAYTALVERRDADLIAALEPAQRAAVSPRLLESMRVLAPPGAPPPPRWVGVNSYVGTGGSTVTLTHQYDYKDEIVTTTSVLIKKDDHWMLRGFNVNIGTPRAPAL